MASAAIRHLQQRWAPELIRSSAGRFTGASFRVTGSTRVFSEAARITAGFGRASLSSSNCDSALEGAARFRTAFFYFPRRFGSAHSIQYEVHRDVGFHFHRLTVQSRWLIAPILN